MSKAIVGVFVEPEDARKAVNSLLANDVDEHRISIMAAEATAKESFAIDEHSKAVEGVAAGGSIGAVAAGIFAGLTAVGALASGGMSILVSGPLVAAMAGAGAGGVTGGVLGGLIGLGFNEYEIKHFEDALDKGSVIVAVNANDVDDGDMIKDVFKKHNAQDVQ